MRLAKISKPEKYEYFSPADNFRSSSVERSNFNQMELLMTLKTFREIDIIATSLKSFVKTWDEGWPQCKDASEHLQIIINLSPNWTASIFLWQHTPSLYQKCYLTRKTHAWVKGDEEIVEVWIVLWGILKWIEKGERNKHPAQKAINYGKLSFYDFSHLSVWFFTKDFVHNLWRLGMRWNEKKYVMKFLDFLNLH